MKTFLNSVSVIIPLYFDQEVVVPLIERLMPVLNDNFLDFEIVFVNDGSKDSTIEVVNSMVQKHREIICIDLIKNVGQQNAISAGIDFAKGELLVIMDSDLQDKPEDIPKLVNALLSDSNAYMAIAQWESRQDSYFKKIVSKLFQRITKKITGIKHEPNLGMFRVIKKEAIIEVRKYSEKTAPIMSLLYWIGFKYITVKLQRDSRIAGTSGYNLTKMIQIALDRIFSYSMLPIRLAVFTGLIIGFISFIIGLFLIFNWFSGGVASGWTSIMVLILFLFGITFIFMGIIGEYLGRIFLETKNRPKYHVHKVYRNKTT